MAKVKQTKLDKVEYAVEKLRNPSVVLHNRKVTVIPCFKTLKAATPFLKHVGRYLSEKAGFMVTVHFNYCNDKGDGIPSEYAYPIKKATP